jgi:ParB/RepB/Spo0J family partition protein
MAKKQINTDTIFAVNPKEQGNDLQLPDARPISDAMIVHVSRIIPMQDQPRSSMDPEVLADISRTARELAAKGGGIDGTGIIQALMGRWAPGSLDAKGQPKKDYKIILVSGETRFWAVKEAGLQYVPIVIRDLNNDDAYEYALIENIVRGELNPLDKARAIRAIMNKRKLTWRAAAEHIFGDVSKRGMIQNLMAILECDEDVQAVIDVRPDTVTSARLIQKVTEPAVRKGLIRDALAGATFSEIDKRVKAWQAANRKSHGKASREEPWSPAPELAFTYGKDAAPKGMTIVPRTNAEDALSVCLRHATLAHDAIRMLHEHKQTYPAAERRKLRAQVAALQGLLDESAHFLDNPPSKRK